MKFCPRCGAPEQILTVNEADPSTGWPMSPDESRIIRCGECGCETRVTSSEQDDGKNISPWTPKSEHVETAINEIRGAAGRLQRLRHGDIAYILEEQCDKIEEEYRLMSYERREQVKDAVDEILELVRANTPGGQSSEEYTEILEQVETIQSIIGRPEEW